VKGVQISRNVFCLGNGRKSQNFGPILRIIPAKSAAAERCYSRVVKAFAVKWFSKS